MAAVFEPDLSEWHADSLDGVRFYDAATGHWLSKDPAQADEVNSYRYCGNNPVNAVDPSGLADPELRKIFLADDRDSDASWPRYVPKLPPAQETPPPNGLAVAIDVMAGIGGAASSALGAVGDVAQAAARSVYWSSDSGANDAASRFAQQVGAGDNTPAIRITEDQVAAYGLKPIGTVKPYGNRSRDFGELIFADLVGVG